MPIKVGGKQLSKEDMFVADILTNLYGAATEKVLMSELEKALSKKPTPKLSDLEQVEKEIEHAKEQVDHHHHEMLNWDDVLQRLYKKRHELEKQTDLKTELDKDLKEIQEKYAKLGLEFDFKI